ncbi:MgtC/SapB family protein [Paraburkholderia sp. MMS20-SJTN17]|uniref:Protein MgtC n=2 Tax=Paraburkholderia translucens TaxID=2886945 RepID=A0ABS8KNB2_9BURK|nr:MgtC/SapB family protein [Paraburkholderia sp. MMS20-SJTN17]MCC8405884.1 MgtC/SapB family protein [Paraburkholderia sp. MMS20-SJTN17]
MSVQLHWSDVLVRIVLALVAGALIGVDRSEAGKTAGLRTTILVCLAACIAMLQVNALLGLSGKSADSFVRLDLMRLPLGILTGVGFIGAGAVFRRDGLITGVTTAATLWFVTVIGLCIGGGQLVLGVLGLGLGLIVLWALQPLEHRLTRDKRAWLTLGYGRDAAGRDALLERLRAAGFALECRGVRQTDEEGGVEERLVVSWRDRSDSDDMAKILSAATTSAGLRSACWASIG